MKLQTLTFAALLALSTTASADWLDGFNNGNGSGNAAGNGAGSTQGNATTKGNAAGKGNGWAAGKGDADGEVDFSINFKGKGRSNMDSKMQAAGDTQGAGDMKNSGNGSATVAGNSAGNMAGSNANNASGQGFSNNSQSQQRMPMNTAQMKIALMAQIQQAQAMLQRIEAQEKTTVAK